MLRRYGCLCRGEQPVSVVYYRSGYAPADYPSEAVSLTHLTPHGSLSQMDTDAALPLFVSEGLAYHQTGSLQVEQNMLLKETFLDSVHVFKLWVLTVDLLTLPRWNGRAGVDGQAATRAIFCSQMPKHIIPFSRFQKDPTRISKARSS